MTQKKQIFCLKMLTLVVMTEYNNFRVRQDKPKKPGSVTATKSDAKNASVFLVDARRRTSQHSVTYRAIKKDTNSSMRRKKERRKHNGRNFDLRETLFGLVGSESKLNDFLALSVIIFCSKVSM